MAEILKDFHNQLFEIFKDLYIYNQHFPGVKEYNYLQYQSTYYYLKNFMLFNILI